MTTLEKIARSLTANDHDARYYARKLRECQIRKARIADLLADELGRIARKRMQKVKP